PHPPSPLILYLFSLFPSMTPFVA
ncbi:MAG: hypothetical protein RLZ81_442, partial [Pseudomonadota bacterium]